MSKHKVLGNHKVAGVEPGELVDSDDLQGANLEGAQYNDKTKGLTDVQKALMTYDP